MLNTKKQVTTYTESSFGHYCVHSSHLQHGYDGQKCGQGRQLTLYSESAKSDHNNTQDTQPVIFIMASMTIRFVDFKVVDIYIRTVGEI